MMSQSTMGHVAIKTKVVIFTCKVKSVSTIKFSFPSKKSLKNTSLRTLQTETSDMANLDLDPYMLTDRAGQNDDSNSATAFVILPGNRRFRFDFRTLFAFLGGYYTMIGTLVVIIQLKFQNESLLPMETHGPFMIISFGALCMTTLASGIMYHTKNDLLSPTYNMILDGAFWFSLILSLLSLVVVILTPQKLKWVGYTMVFVLFLMMVVFYLKDLKRLLDKKHADSVGALELV